MSIKAVIFDYGEVITFPQDTKAIDRIAQVAGVQRNKFESLLWALRPEFDRGTINAREYYNKILSRFAVSIDDEIIDKMIEIDFDSWKNINGQTVALMEDVKKAGYILGILSNMPHEFLAWARKNIPVFSLAQISLFSCEVNLVKPEVGIYKKLLSMAGVEGRELVFFDDKPENIQGARALGIQALLWKTCENARQELSALGVRL